MSTDELQTGTTPGTPDGAGTPRTAGAGEDVLRALFQDGGTPRPVTGQHPLLLDDTDLVWLVTGAPVHLFVVPLDGDADGEARLPLASQEIGDLLFAPAPVEVDGQRYGILAAGLPDTRLIALPTAVLRSYFESAPLGATLERSLSRWMVSLQSRVRPPYAPQHAGPVVPSGETTIGAGEPIMAYNEPAWLEVREGSVTLFGLPRLEIRPADGPVLLADDSWVTAREPATVACLDDVHHDMLVGAARLVTRLTIAAAVVREQEARRRERERLVQADTTDRAMTDRALRDILDVYEHDRTVPLPDATVVQDRLLAASMLVGAARGIDVVAPPATNEPSADPLRTIARASRFRTRQVLLDGEWWQDDSGALLGSLAQGGEAVALIPHPGKGYVAIDPLTGQETKVDREVARRFSPWAHMFYRPFPQRAITAKDLLSFSFRDTKRDLIAIVLLGILGGLLGIATPLATGLLVDSVIPESDRAQLVELSLALIAAAFAIAAFTITRNVALLRAEGRADGAAQAAIWDRLLGLPVPFFKDYTAGELGNRAMGIDRIRQSLSDSTTTAILAFVFSVPSFILQLVIDVRLALISLALLVTLLGLTVLATRRQLRLQRRMLAVGGFLSGLILQILNGIPKLRVAGGEQRAFSIWAASYSEQSTLIRSNQITQLQLTVLYSTFPVLATFVLFGVYATREWFSISLGEFLSFNAAFTQVIGATIAMSTAIGTLTMVIPIYERMRPILDSLPETDDDKADPGILRGEIEVSAVRFAYNEGDPPIIDDVSFRARPGEFIAFVGPSGAGKSTLFRLLMGFETPDSGSVLYDGKNLETVDLQALRRQLGVVLQNGTLMPGELGQNIIGATQMTLDDAWEAARMAGLAEDIDQMPMGMHTYIMEGGTTLSGGQRQRLMIARAIVNRPRILLFDEATSALDNRTQEIVSRSLEGLNSTRIVIAHRLSTIAKADVIHVMERGRIVQSGTYDELMRQDGPFRELARRQIA